ncbi:STAS domain-containing protein [Pseudonocardia sp.]|uniref:STAS domain-containing protein n=1 Tax=Pseudonocardia sp. TaxID=60912 RepID=UPI00261C92BE|nr:STAS domain-containing protein [Pseudonocardia sp.]
MYRYDAPLCFANAEHFRRRALHALDDAEPAPRRLLLNMEAVLEIDITAVDALLGLCDELDHRGVQLAMAHVKHDLRQDLRRSGGVAQRIGEQHIQPTLPTAVEAFRRSEGEVTMTKPVTSTSPRTRRTAPDGPEGVPVVTCLIDPPAVRPPDSAP